MGNEDIYLCRYFSSEERLADFFNVTLCHGEEVFIPERLEKVGGESSAALKDRHGATIGVKRYRDILMRADYAGKQILLALEIQKEIHNAMVVRTMLYDAMNYTEQVQTTSKRNRKKKRLKGSRDFLSGLTRMDRILPTLTVVMYYGKKRWRGCQDIYSVTGIVDERFEKLKDYISNYHINLVDVRDLAKRKDFKTDLKWLFGMLQYKDDKKKMREYVNEHEEYFRNIDEDTFGAMKAILGDSRLHIKLTEDEGRIDMCKALEDLYQDGKTEGRTEGRTEGANSKAETVARNMFLRNMSAEDTAAICEEGLSKVQAWFEAWRRS